MTTENCVTIAVRDTGGGISAEHLPHVFDRFYQAGDAYAEDSHGTGIGLALAKELVELHQGTISVESEVGKGSVFAIRLPIGKAHLQPEEIRPNAELGMGNAELLRRDDILASSEAANTYSAPQSKNSEIDTSEFRIPHSEIDTSEFRNPNSAFPEGTVRIPHSEIALVVEDNPDMRAYIREILAETYDVIEAENGRVGLEKAVEIIPDIIISDVMMPEMDGIQFCEKIKTDERSSHIPVILLTAKSSGESKLEGLETGADDYLVKPFDSAELLVRMKNLIKQRRELRERFRQEITLAPENIALTSADAKFLQRIIDTVEENIDAADFGVRELSAVVGMSRSQLHRKLKALTDQPPLEFIRSIKLKRAAALLEHHTGNISEIAYQVGFSNPSYFAECFRKLYGISPREYSRQVDE